MWVTQRDVPCPCIHHMGTTNLSQVVSTQVQLGDFGTLRDAAQVRPTVREAGTPLIVRPCSIKFVVLPEARLPQCM